MEGDPDPLGCFGILRSRPSMDASVAGTSGEEDTMRRISNVISVLLIIALVVGLVAFSIGNGTQFALSFFGYTFYHVPVWVID
jgi:hypothetical protein